MNAGEHHLSVTGCRQRAHLRMNVLHGPAAHPASGIGNDTVAAELVAAVLHLDVRPGVLRRPGET